MECRIFWDGRFGAASLSPLVSSRPIQSQSLVQCRYKTDFGIICYVDSCVFIITLLYERFLNFLFSSFDLQIKRFSSILFALIPLDKVYIYLKEIRKLCLLHS